MALKITPKILPGVGSCARRRITGTGAIQERRSMTDKDRIAKLLKEIKEVITFPPKGYARRTKEGYPQEVEYDEFAYQRMVDSYRDALKAILKKYK